MREETLQIKTEDGVAPCQVFAGDGDGRRPGVLFYMDAIGVRPALSAMCRRLSGEGYVVLLPELYYRSGRYAPFDAATVFAPGPQLERLMALYQSIDQARIMRDTASYLAVLEARSDVAAGGIGCTGYCMGGAFALSAAGTFPERIVAAASYHGARLATDAPDSPHRLASQIKGEIYVGVAGIDPHFPAEEKLRLSKALADAGVRHSVEVYPEVKHGFAVDDHPAFNRSAAERHWTTLLDLFARNLSR